MQELSQYEALNVIGGAKIIASPLYGFIKVWRYIVKFISSRF